MQGKWARGPKKLALLKRRKSHVSRKSAGRDIFVQRVDAVWGAVGGREPMVEDKEIDSVGRVGSGVCEDVFRGARPAGAGWAFGDRAFFVETYEWNE